MKVCDEVKRTTNRSVFNRAYKQHLERLGKIHCSYCMYHKSENDSTKYYYIEEDDARYPNWKLSTKNSKQWEFKKLKLNEKFYRIDGSKYFEIEI